MSRTYALLEITQRAFEEIRDKMHQAGYDQAFIRGTDHIDMHGVAVAPLPRGAPASPIEMHQVGRIAYREEGESWNAYWAMPDTMDRAIFLGGIRMAFATNPVHKQAFMVLIRECVADMLEVKFGIRPVFNVEAPGPEHERGGNT